MKIEKWLGKTITKPGIYKGIPLAKYHAGDICDGPSISSSGLRKIWSTSPAHFWAGSPLNPKAEKFTPTKAMILGSAGHHLFCGEDEFATQFAVRPDTWKDWRTNASQDWRALQESEGRTVLTPDQLEQIRGMARSLATHPIIKAGILNGHMEASMFWKDEETGLWLKSRPDSIPTDGSDFADIKCTHSVLDYDLRQSVSNLGYAQQGALICEVAYRLLKVPTTSFTLVWVEQDPPHCVRITTMPEADLQRGERQNRIALRTIAKCLKDGVWPGPGNADAEMLGLSQGAAEWTDKRIEAMEAQQ